MDAHSEAKLQFVHPTLADKIRQLDEMFQLAHTGDALTVQQGLRAFADQARIYAQGRTAPGAIVTNAPPGHSWHEFGLAVDVCPVSLLSDPQWTPQSPLWPDIGAKGKSLGLFWGGDFVLRPDKPHFQLTGSLPVSPNDATRQAYLDGGTFAVWDKAGITTFAQDIDGEIAT